MAAKQPQYSPKQVGEALQVSESSIKRWCDAGKIGTVRTLGGHRRITLDALQAFLQENGRSLSDPAALGLPSMWPGASPAIPGDAAPELEKFREALASGDESTCSEILRHRIGRGDSPAEAITALLCDAMTGIGEAWQCDSLDVYQERRGCEIALRLIRKLRSELPPPKSNAPVAIGGAPEGDNYQIPTALVELTLRQIGWNAINLGHNLPIDSFLTAAVEYNPNLVWMSVSVVTDKAMFVAAQTKLATSLGDHVPFLVGGQALTDQLRPRLRYTAHCDNLGQLAEFASMLRLNLNR